MKSHTPGPFPLKITQSDDFFVIITNQGNHYAKTFDPAAAHLIASAPDLLRALEQLLETAESLNDWLVSDGSINGEHELFKKVRAIISKAKGEA
jgi:hypothetical protein